MHLRGDQVGRVPLEVQRCLGDGVTFRRAQVRRADGQDAKTAAVSAVDVGAVSVVLHGIGGVMGWGLGVGDSAQRGKVACSANVAGVGPARQLVTMSAGDPQGIGLAFGMDVQQKSAGSFGGALNVNGVVVRGRFSVLHSVCGSEGVQACGRGMSCRVISTVSGGTGRT
jgi:hypothetical protein